MEEAERQGSQGDYRAARVRQVERVFISGADLQGGGANWFAGLSNDPGWNQDHLQTLPDRDETTGKER